ncbi:hypothetical protein JFL43_20550 [Viridibacillus sp. YIM B01967]|uniref:Uncharacterized protein n=1 Tax=Viridibacillus soli TaxID=2798301 RepID=A0ABS1HD53_9BACL|nr:hypothetical protein [Viridibacillus soli]MBK3497174.1 hypothetical protein [Viridibacillus soli]
MNYKSSKVKGHPILLNHQQFIYFDSEQELKTSVDSWPALQRFSRGEFLSSNARKLFSIMRDIALEEGINTISRNSISKKSQGIAKKSAHLTELLNFLYNKGYLSFQRGGVYGHKKFITLNPCFFT